MTAAQYREVVDFESSLAPDSPVVARWTNGGSYYKAGAKVKRVNASSVRVILTEEIVRDGQVVYPVGREIVCPTLSDIKRWSANNSVWKE